MKKACSLCVEERLENGFDALNGDVRCVCETTDDADDGVSVGRACRRKTRDATRVVHGTDWSHRRRSGRMMDGLEKVARQSGYMHTVWNGETDDVLTASLVFAHTLGCQVRLHRAAGLVPGIRHLPGRW